MYRKDSWLRLVYSLVNIAPIPLKRCVHYEYKNALISYYSAFKMFFLDKEVLIN